MGMESPKIASLFDQEKLEQISNRAKAARIRDAYSPTPEGAYNEHVAEVYEHIDRPDLNQPEWSDIITKTDRLEKIRRYYKELCTRDGLEYETMEVGEDDIYAIRFKDGTFIAPTEWINEYFKLGTN